MIELTRNAVAEALHKAVAEKGGDYVYPIENGCRYSTVGDEGQVYPSCIVGHVVAALAPDVFESWADYESEEGDSFSVFDGLKEQPYDYPSNYDENGAWIQDSPEANKVRKAIEVDQVTEVALFAAQEIQDAGLPWKDAQEAFDRVMAGEDEYAVKRDIEERAE